VCSRHLEVLFSLSMHLFDGNSPRQVALLVNWQRARCRLGQILRRLRIVRQRSTQLLLGSYSWDGVASC
jgi:hypothetical protein